MIVHITAHTSIICHYVVHSEDKESGFFCSWSPVDYAQTAPGKGNLGIGRNTPETGVILGRRLDEIETAVVRALRLAPPLPRLVMIEGPADHSLGILSTIAIAKVRAVLEGCEWVVATDAGRHVGVVGVHRYGTRQRYARIRAVWLDPAHRGTGLGAYMTDFAIALAAARRGVVRLDVFAINPRFYLERGWTMSPRPQGNRSPQLTLVAVASAIALRGLRRPYPLPPTGHRPPRSAVTMLPARPFDWHLDDPDLSDRAAHRYAIADAFDVPAEIVGLWPAPSRRP